MASNSTSYPVSSNSRKKLNAFRYADDTVASNTTTSKDGTTKAHRNKENQSSWLNGVVDPMQTSPDKAEKSEKTEAPVAEAPPTESKPLKDCPQTPGNRIPLADLISNAEDSFNPAPGPEVTPVDHVIWQHIPASSNPDSSSQTPAGRRRKRRHSSSPPGSPSKDNSKKSQKEPLDLQSIQALFKTPQHDLATELWNNYVDKNMVESSEDLPAPRLANLLSSSPQTPISGRSSRDSSGLRRSISCAAEWPTSRAKRRRNNRQDPNNRGTFSRATSNVLDSGKRNASKINFLVDELARSLKPAQPVSARPPNSSPLRQRLDAERCRSSSPTVDRKGQGDTKLEREALPAPAKNTYAIPPPILEESSSDFGDDDIDQDLMDLADASEDPFVVPPASRGSVNEFGSFGSSGWSKLGVDKVNSSNPKQPPLPANPPIMHNITNNETKPDDSEDFDDDEFGDFDDEILAECDKKSAQFAPPTTSATAKQTVKRPDPSPVAAVPKVPVNVSNGAANEFSDDEFDDDFDFDALEQTMKQTGADGPYVCPS